jgi:hypothetical protein
MLTQQDLTQIRFICVSLGATTQEEITDIVNRYIAAKKLHKINVNKVITTITDELDKDN